MVSESVHATDDQTASQKTKKGSMGDPTHLRKRVSSAIYNAA